MSSFSQSVRFQDDSEYNKSCNYTSKQPSRQPFIKYSSKHTNTPGGFMLCLNCKEKIGKKNEQQPNCAVGDGITSISEYTKALNYINSCHSLINEMMMSQTKEGFNFKMPDLPNFVDIFNSLSNSSQLTGRETAKLHKKSTHESRVNTKSIDERNRSHSSENSRSVSPKISFNKQQVGDESVRQTTKGKFIELLPEVNHEKNNFKSPSGNLSPGTTESEESDLEMNILQKHSRMVMTNKYKSKLKPTQEKVIYEEDSNEDDSVNKTIDEPCQKSKPTENTTRKSSAVERLRSTLQSSLPTHKKLSHTMNTPPSAVTCNSPNNNDISKRIKQRPSSASRERSKMATNNKYVNEEGGNFCDTITSGSTQNKKFGQQTLRTPNDFRNKELSQQDLDKYAKELLGSESISPRSKSPPAPNAVSCSGTCTKSKCEVEKRKNVKPSPAYPVKLRTSDLRKKTCQDRQSANNDTTDNTSKISPNTNSNNTQQNREQLKKPKKSVIPQPQVEQQNQIKKQNSCKKPNANFNNYPFGGVQPPCDVNYVKIRHEICSTPQKQTEDENKMQCRNDCLDDDDDEDDVCSSPEQLNLLCDNTEMLNMNSRSYLQSGKSVTTKQKVQYSVTTKPIDFFTTNRKSSNTNTTMAVFREEDEEEYEDTNDDVNVESDDIKTDSDIDDGHFENVEKEDEVSLSRKSSKTNKPNISQVLNQLGLHVPQVTEQMLNEAKSTRAKDERNKPFREPRKSNGDSNERIVLNALNIEENKRMRDVYATERATHLHRTPSEESSDIKSDDEVYNNVGSKYTKKTVPFNYCLGNGR